MSDSATSTVELGHEAIDQPHKRQSVALDSSNKPVEKKSSIKAVDENVKQVTVTWSGISIYAPASEAMQGDTLWSDANPMNSVRMFSQKKETVMVFQTVVLYFGSILILRYRQFSTI